MERNVRVAVILAAGKGERLGHAMGEIPKGFIQLGKKSIIEESIDKLIYCGIDQVIIVTGYLSKYYDELAETYDCIKTIKNEEYNNSGSMYSLYCAKDMIHEDFLLLESDLIYEVRALQEVIKLQKKDVILVSGHTNAGDEVFVSAKNDYLLNMSKNEKLENIIGELVGISKISENFLRIMIGQCEDEFKQSIMHNYEVDGFVRAGKIEDIYCHKISDLIWAEIDDYKQYCNAKENIYPKITGKE
jgi:choline kinase